MAMMSSKEEKCSVVISRNTYSVLENLMKETKLNCEELLKELIDLYRRTYPVTNTPANDPKFLLDSPCREPSDQLEENTSEHETSVKPSSVSHVSNPRRVTRSVARIRTRSKRTEEIKSLDDCDVNDSSKPGCYNSDHKNTIPCIDSGELGYFHSNNKNFTQGVDFPILVQGHSETATRYKTLDVRAEVASNESVRNTTTTTCNPTCISDISDSENTKDDPSLHDLQEEEKIVRTNREEKDQKHTKKNRKRQKTGNNNGRKKTKKKKINQDVKDSAEEKKDSKGKVEKCPQDLQEETEQAIEIINHLKSSEPPDDVSQKKESGKDGSRPFYCLVCASVFKLRHHLQSHMSVHNSEKTYKCNECEKQFKSADNLKRHTKTHLVNRASKKYKCEDCDYCSDYPSELNKHKRRHTNEKCFKCNLCDFATIWKKNLRDHMTTHSGLKKYKCSDCEYVTHNKITLSSHWKSRHGARAICHICGQEYCSLSYLKEHLNRHTQVKSFSCGHCDFQSSFKSNVRKHILIHEVKKYKCETCKQRFTQKAHLNAHVKAIHSIPCKEYRCKECNYVSMRSQSLNSHMKKHKQKTVNKEQEQNQSLPVLDELKESKSEEIPPKTEASASLDNLVAAAEILAECSTTSKDPNYAVADVGMESAHQVAPVLVADGDLLVSIPYPCTNPYPLPQPQPQLYLSSDFTNLEPLQSTCQDNLTLPVLNVQDFQPPQGDGDGYSTYTIHHVVAPQ